MSISPDIAIIADDLTGAADTGVQFCPYIGQVYMAGYDQLPSGPADIQCAGLAIFTNTRNIDPAVAGTVVYQTTQAVQKLAPRTIYKKIDSSLRGNLGSELDAMVSALDSPVSFISPALPQQGRTTVNDYHQINGIPISETEIGRDPLSPVKHSRLSVLFASQSQMAVGHIHLSDLEKGTDLLFDRVQKVINQGCRHIVFDARTSSHLDTIANLSRDRFKNVLLVGSAGLAGSLAKIMNKKLPVRIKTVQFQLKKWLFVCGSASQVLAKQTAALAQSESWPQIIIDPDILAAGEASVRHKALVTELATSWARGSLIISIAPRLDTDPTQQPDRVMRGLTDIVASLLTLSLPEALFLSGGDTAEAVMRRTGSPAVFLQKEILPGLVYSKVGGGLLNGLPLITKPGSFGKPETLIKLLHSLT